MTAELDVDARAEVHACFDAYEAALVAGDVEAMNEWFVDDPRAIRFGIADEQWGSAALREWRRTSPAVPPGRQIESTDVLVWSADLAVVTTLFRYTGSPALGRQSQVWGRTSDGWRIVHAHVSERSVGRRRIAMSASIWDGWDVARACAAARALDNPAFITVRDDDSVTRAALDAGNGPLHGVPFAVKDNIDVVGMPTTAGYPGRSTPAASSATAVERLVAAGAVAIGKTNMDQFATGLVGTRSPYGACHCVDSTEHVSGGSSSGSAVAVAAGIVAFALATDTAGSGRVPAAFNGLVGVKPTRGLVSTLGVFPACPSLDCVSIMTTTVGLARTVLKIIAGFDARDPWSRPTPSPLPAGVAATMQVVGVPVGPLDLDGPHRDAWRDAVARVGDVADLVPVDVTPLLDAAALLYGGPFVAERLAAFGHLLEPERAGLDPSVRSIVLGARDLSARELFAAQHRLAQLARETELLFAGIDAVLLPTTPGHPRIEEVRSDPIGVNTRLGTYTNMVNLLDLCAVAVPVGTRQDGLPFGVQLLGPAFADDALLDLAARVLGEAVSAPAVAPEHSLLAVCGAHLSGQPLNTVLRESGARLHSRSRTKAGYRMVRIDGPVPRPGLIDDGQGPHAGIEIELWDTPLTVIRALEVDLVAPLRIATVHLMDGSHVPGFTADPDAIGAAVDISAAGGWRRHLADTSV